jgi:hypothetical protein
VGDGNDNNCDGVDGFDGDGAASEESGGTDCHDADPDYSVGCWVQVSAGSWHTCAIDNRGVLTCWGSDSDGAATPADGEYKLVQAGGSSSCAINMDDQIVCWGTNTSGQLDVPETTWTDLAMTSLHGCGLYGAGGVSCWGLNSSGQTTSPSGAFSLIAAGNSHACAHKATGATECWGNWDETDPDYEAPVGTFSKLTAGGSHTCALGSGQPHCWGSNSCGQASSPGGGVCRCGCGCRIHLRHPEPIQRVVVLGIRVVDWRGSHRGVPGGEFGECAFVCHRRRSSNPVLGLWEPLRRRPVRPAVAIVRTAPRLPVVAPAEFGYLVRPMEFPCTDRFCP